MRYYQDNELPCHQLIYWCGKARQPDDATSSFVSVAMSAGESKSAAPTLTVDLPNGISISGVNAETIELVSQLLRTL